MKTPFATHKLRESEFFLHHLEKAANERAAGNEPQETLRFYLSAFLSAAKSVIEIVKWERHGRLYREWEAALPAKDRNLLRFIGYQRDAEVHRRGARLEPRRINLIQYLYPSVRALRFTEVMGDKIEYGPTGIGKLPKWIKVTRHGVEHRFKIDGHWLRMVAACRRCFFLLRHLLQSIEYAPSEPRSTSRGPKRSK